MALKKWQQPEMLSTIEIWIWPVGRNKCLVKNFAWVRYQTEC